MKTSAILGAAAMTWALFGCSPQTEALDDGDEQTEDSSDAVQTAAGVNGGACYLSDYDCKLRVKGGNRIQHKDGSVDWGVESNVEVLDGNGDVLGVNHGSSLKFNYGQRRTFHGEDYVFAMTTSNHSSGWFPLSKVKSADVLSSRVGSVHAHRAGLSKMHCYEVKDSSDPNLEVKKVVKDTESSPGPAGEAAGDYLPRMRANGKRSVNLIYNLPGYALGGPAIDHFPAGTKFQRVDVPTEEGPPSLDVALWQQASNGHFTKPAGSMKFIYGYVVTKTGEVRVGWMAYDALKSASGCPDP